MRTICENEILAVAGGAGIADKALNYCAGMPGDAEITVTVTAKGNIGVGGVNTGTESTFLMKTTCGKLREEAEKAKKPDPKKASFMGYDMSGFDFHFEYNKGRYDGTPDSRMPISL